MSADATSLCFALHNKAGIQVFEWTAGSAVAPKPIDGLKFEGGASRVFFSRDGSLVAAIRSADVAVRSVDRTRAAAAAADVDVPRSRVARAAFSPRGTFLTTWERIEPEGAAGNLCIWRLPAHVIGPATPAAVQLVASFPRKEAPTGDTWPLLIWSSDEAVCARLLRDGIELLDGTNPASPAVGRISHAGVSQFSWCPVADPPGSSPLRHLLATFVPPRKGMAGAVSIFDAEKVTSAGAVADEPISRKNFFEADNCSLEWTPNAAQPVLLAHISTDSDPSGKSYYGTSALLILYANRPELNGNIVLKKEGTIHHIAWSPSGKFFSVVYGYMPAMVTVFELHTNGSYAPKADLGPSSRNIVIFSPDGNTICCGGFGNLQGEMDFYDASSFARLGKAQAHTSTSWTWSPDGQFFCCAICAPRRRVDNGFRVFSVAGEFVYQEAVQELYDFVWGPNPKLTARSKKSPRPATKAAAADGAGTSQPPAPAPQPVQEKYRPPAARGTTCSIVVHEEAQRDRVTVYSQGKAVQASRQRAPGAGPALSKAQQKKQRALLKKQREEEEAAIIEAATTSAGMRSRSTPATK